MRFSNKSSSAPEMAIASTFEATPPLSYKVILLGDFGVGKTTFLEQVRREMQSSVTELKWAEFTCSLQGETQGRHSRGIESVEFTLFTASLSLKVRLFDTAGAERYQRSAVTSNYFRDSDAALLMYSVADSNTFENLTEWIELHREKVENTMVILPCFTILYNIEQPWFFQIHRCCYTLL
ncbi:hypothetical protein EMCRGX_G031299 [Ephydatia muelleri]